MKWFYNLKTARKLGLGFGLCLSLAFVIGMVSITRMGQINASTKLVLDDALVGVETVGQLINDTKQFRIDEFKHLLAHNATEKASFEEHIRVTTAKINEDIAACEKSVSGPEERANVDKFKELWNAYLAEHDAYMAVSEKNDLKSGTAMMFKGAVGFNKAIDALDVMSKSNIKQGDVLGKQAEGTYTGARSTVIALLAFAIAIGVVIATAITRYVVSILKEVSSRLEMLSGKCVTNLRKATEALANGDVTAKIDTGTTTLDFESKDEFGSMAKSLNSIILGVQGTVASFETAQESLSKLISETKSASDGIATASSEVAAGNADLSQRTEEQAASLEETAASMEEMASTVKQTADNSKLANQLAAQARQVASDGGVVVRDAVSAMAAINEGSKRIAEIISVIDDIAFQTNLLALNAAVEAARVGEQGRGFAVVASEVRNLAGRSATAAKEIKALVQDSVSKVQNGSVLVNQSGERLDEIETAVKKVADVIAEISAASIEQSVGIDQVNKAVMQMDQVTQQNASLVEEISASSQSTSEVAQSLQELISQFKVDPKYMLTVHRNESKPIKQKATGTDGLSARRPQPVKLSIAKNDDGFEDF